MDFDSLLYRRVLGQFATGVTVVTTITGSDEPWAMTANSFTSISLDPPIVLVSVSRGITTNDAIRASGVFAVNILRAEQIELARRYSRRERPPKQFGDVETSTSSTGSLIIAGCLGWVDCRLTEATEQGDHTVFFGTVESLDIAEHGGDPLLYYHSSYSRIEPDPRSLPDEAAAKQGRLIYFDAEAGNY